MKKILITLIIALGFMSGISAQSQRSFFYLSTLKMYQDSASPVKATDSVYNAPPTPPLHVASDSVVWLLQGTPSKASSVKTDSLIMPVPFQYQGTSGIMDFGIRADSTATLDSVQVRQNNVLIYTYNGGSSYNGHFKTADVFFPFVSGAFIIPNKFVIKPILSRVTSKKRKVWISPNYYQQ